MKNAPKHKHTVESEWHGNSEAAPGTEAEGDLPIREVSGTAAFRRSGRMARRKTSENGM